jgi:hypothetical protein
MANRSEGLMRKVEEGEEEEEEEESGQDVERNGVDLFTGTISALSWRD